MRSNYKGKHVLIVDDEPDIREFLKWEFEDRHATVFDTEDFDEAFRHFKEKKPDFSILDIRMASGSGVELLAKCKQVWPDLPIALMTGYTEITPQSIFDKGACDVFVKPLQYEHLFPRVDKEMQKLEERYKIFDSQEPAFVEIKSLDDREIIHFGVGGFMLQVPFVQSTEVGREYVVKAEDGSLRGVLRWVHMSQFGGMKLGFELVGMTPNLKDRVFHKISGDHHIAYIPLTS